MNGSYAPQSTSDALVAQGAPPLASLFTSLVSGPQWFQFACTFPDNAVTAVNLRLAAAIVDRELSTVRGAAADNPDLWLIIDDFLYILPMASETEAIQEAVKESAGLHVRYDNFERFQELGPYIRTTDNVGYPALAAGVQAREGWGNRFDGDDAVRPVYIPVGRATSFEMVPRAAVNLANATSGAGTLWLHGWAWSNGELTPPQEAPNAGNALALRSMQPPRPGAIGSANEVLALGAAAVGTDKGTSSALGRQVARGLLTGPQKR